MDIIRKGMQGISVGRVQQALTEAGYAIVQTELMTSTFGDSTYNGVRSFQASHLDQNGHPLGEDGVVGDATWYALQHPGQAGFGGYTVAGWRCEPSQAREAVRHVLEIAVNELGVHEDPDGSNDGVRIRAYTAPDFIGSPWCSLYASWCFSHCDGGSPFGRIASTYSLYDWAKANGRVLGENDAPQAGDIFVILRDQRHGHTGIICYSFGDGKFACLEGNASNACRGTIRIRSGVSAIIRPIPIV